MSGVVHRPRKFISKFESQTLTILDGQTHKIKYLTPEELDELSDDRTLLDIQNNLRIVLDILNSTTCEELIILSYCADCIEHYLRTEEHDGYIDLFTVLDRLYSTVDTIYKSIKISLKMDDKNLTDYGLKVKDWSHDFHSLLSNITAYLITTCSKFKVVDVKGRQPRESTYFFPEILFRNLSSFKKFSVNTDKIHEINDSPSKPFESSGYSKSSEYPKPFKTVESFKTSETPRSSSSSVTHRSSSSSVTSKPSTPKIEPDTKHKLHSSRSDSGSEYKSHSSSESKPYPSRSEPGTEYKSESKPYSSRSDSGSEYKSQSSRSESKSHSYRPESKPYSSPEYKPYSSRPESKTEHKSESRTEPRTESKTVTIRDGSVLKHYDDYWNEQDNMKRDPRAPQQNTRERHIKRKDHLGYFVRDIQNEVYEIDNELLKDYGDKGQKCILLGAFYDVYDEYCRGKGIDPYGEMYFRGHREIANAFRIIKGISRGDNNKYFLL